MALWRQFLAHELLGCAHHMLGGGVRPPQRLHHMLGGGVGGAEKGAPLPGSDVRLLRS